jgi:hypothetical protein
MPTEEEEISLTKWRDLLGTELIIALEELAKNHKDGANKRHQYYVENCAEQYWTMIARITVTMGGTRTDWIPFGLQPGNKPFGRSGVLAETAGVISTCDISAVATGSSLGESTP